MRKFVLIFLLFICLSCEFNSKDYFPSIYGLKWVYSVVIESSYTGKKNTKRVMVTNFNVNKKKKNLEVSRLYSDGSYYTYEIGKKKITRTSVILTFAEGIVEPVKKVIYPDIYFNQKEWVVREQLFLVKGFQPPLLNVKPRSQFDMIYSIKKEHKRFKVKSSTFYDCIEIEGKGSSNFIGDTRSGPINVDVINTEILCNDVGLVKQIRSENTNASAFGNMILKKELISFD